VSNKIPISLMIAGLVLLFLIGVGTRRQVFRSQPAVQERWKNGKEVPFTYESALQFRQTRILYEMGALPEVDPQIRTGEISRNVEAGAGVDSGTAAGTNEPSPNVNAGVKGVKLDETYSLGSEHWYVALAKIMPRSWSLENRFRWAALLLFCLTIPLLALWVGLRTRSAAAGAVAGLLFAVCYAAVVRSTGLELSRENFALPWLAAFLAAQAWSGLNLRSGRWTFWLAVVCSGVCLALAQCYWDLVQFVVAIWVLGFAVQWLLVPNAALGAVGSTAERVRTAAQWWIPFGCLLVAGFVNPYLSYHGFVSSAPMLLGLGLALVLALQVFSGRGDSTAADGTRLGLGPVRWWHGLLVLLPLAWLLIGGGESYGHFGSLLAAKIQHFNIKPADPQLLSYEQRVMWTPALHSSTWYHLFDVFPYLLYAGVLAMGGFALRAREHRGVLLGSVAGLMLVLLLFNDHLGFRLPRSLSLPAFALSCGLFGLYLFGFARWGATSRHGASESAQPMHSQSHATAVRWIFWFGFTWLCFVFFFRMHVFTVFFLCALIGGGIAAMGDLRGTQDATDQTNVGVWRFGFPLAIGLGLSVALLELTALLDPFGGVKSAQSKAAKSGLLDRPGVNYAQLAEVVDAVNKLAKDMPEPPVVLANFPLSASVAGYTDCPVVLHPKFETEDIRAKVKEFYEQLYITTNNQTAAGVEFDFYEWTQKQGAAIYIQHPGANAGTRAAQFEHMLKNPNLPAEAKRAITKILKSVRFPDNRPVYMAGLTEAEPGSMVTLFERSPNALRYFKPVRLADPANRFRVFRIITHQDIDMGVRQASMARRQFEMGDYSRAFDYAERTITMYDPGNPTAKRIINKLTTLLFQGKITRDELKERIQHLYEETPKP